MAQINSHHHQESPFWKLHLQVKVVGVLSNLQ
ncbi:hypothetical protein PVAP13_2KG285900 [Panicum virgatum]|uniref:Uncharacterized protein n=1 Tax=Panicum virgatum TaxID=38727 RepID=A0A8T0WE19_PANVG|nr:hypothetical protein PVAP13_2KG285900 [Panicum virgatum]